MLTALFSVLWFVFSVTVGGFVFTLCPYRKTVKNVLRVKSKSQNYSNYYIHFLIPDPQIASCY